MIVLFISCRARTTTPNKYKYSLNVSKVIYNKHKDILADSIKVFVTERRKAYYPTENDSLTEFSIDTIVYSPHVDKIIFFVITKNSNNKLPSNGSINEFHYEARCFIAIVDSNELKSISWLSAYNLTNYHSYEKVSNRIRDVYFKNINGSRRQIKFNLDDIRFWDDEKIWSNEINYVEIFEDDQ